MTTLENHPNPARVDGTPAHTDDPSAFLAPTYFLDADNPNVGEFASTNAGDKTTDKERAVALFYAVRDQFRYDPYSISQSPSAYRASAVIEAGAGWCVTKSATMVACLRSLGIPARPGYADVRNHLTSEKLAEKMGTDVFSYHGYAEIWLDNRWVKATPVFNIELCDKVGVRPQEFDGHDDSLFQEFDREGRRHMEYLKMRGAYTDIPLAEIFDDFRTRYAYLGFGELEGDFAEDAAALKRSETAENAEA